MKHIDLAVSVMFHEVYLVFRFVRFIVMADLNVRAYIRPAGDETTTHHTDMQRSEGCDTKRQSGEVKLIQMSGDFVIQVGSTS